MIKNIKFKSLKVEGFGSFIEENTFILDRLDSVNIVVGDNGSGKTTIFNALFWCLFGENLKGVISSNLVSKKQYRGDDWRGTRVAISLIVDGSSYIIIRHINFKGESMGVEGKTSLMIFENKKLIGDGLHKEDQKHYIIELLGVDSKMFLNSILFGQRMKKFIEASPEEKRKIFESLFDLDFIEASKANAVSVKQELDCSVATLKLNSEKKVVTSIILEDKIKINEEYINDFNIKKKERINKFLSRQGEEEIKLQEVKKLMLTNETICNNLKKQINAINLDNYEELIIKLEELKSKKISVSRNIHDTEEEIENLTGEIEEKKEGVLNIDVNCPTCLQEFPKTKIENIKNSINKNIRAIKESIKIHKSNLVIYKEETDNIKLVELENEIKVESTSVNKLGELKENFGKCVSLQDNYKLKLTMLTEVIEQIKSDIINENKAKPPKVDVDKLNKELKNLRSDIKSNKLKSEALDKKIERVSWWVKVGFGFAGIKSYIFNAMMEQLNSSVLKYAQRLGFLVSFSIDMSKATKPFLTECYTIDGVKMNYDEFSGGEKARVDIASAFAIHDLVGGSVNINILIMDEIFEGLDESGIADAFDLIRLKANFKTLYVITHSTVVDGRHCKIINVVKEEYNSKII